VRGDRSSERTCIVRGGKPRRRAEKVGSPCRKGWPEPRPFASSGAGRKLDPDAARPFAVLLMMICLAVLADSASLHKVSLPA